MILATHRLVETRRGLVQHDELGFADQCAGDGDALLLPARELRRTPLAHGGAQSDELQGLVDARIDLGGVPRDVQEFERLRQRGFDGETSVQGLCRVLEDHLDTSALLRCMPRDREGFSVEAHLTLRGAGEPDDHAGQGRLAAAGFTHDADGLAGLDLQVDTANGWNRAGAVPVGLVDFVDVKQCQRVPPRAGSRMPGGGKRPRRGAGCRRTARRRARTGAGTDTR